MLPPLKKGWRTTLDLRFQQAGGKIILASAQHADPLAARCPSYPEEETYHPYLLHPPNGIVGSDELTVITHLDPGCHTLITTPGASELYRSSGAQVLLRQQLTLTPQAALEWFPQDATLFPGTNARLSTTFHLCASNTLLAWDLLYLGRPAIGETFSHGILSSRLGVWVGKIPLPAKRLHLQEGGLFSVAGCLWVGTSLRYSATNALPDGVRDALASLDLYTGASLTGRLLTVHFLSDDDPICQQVMCDVWQSLRPHLIDKSPVLPRIWLTQENVMELTPREKDKLLLLTAALVTEHRLARGLELSYPESVALISTLVVEGTRDGKNVASLMEEDHHVLVHEQMMEGVPEVVPDIQVEVTFPGGSKLVTVHSPII